MRARGAEAIPRMRVGELARLTCAPEYAYGERGAPPKIPGNTTLECEVAAQSRRRCGAERSAEAWRARAGAAGRGERSGGGARGAGGAVSEHVSAAPVEMRWRARWGGGAAGLREQGWGGQGGAGVGGGGAGQVQGGA